MRITPRKSWLPWICQDPQESHAVQAHLVQDQACRGGPYRQSRSTSTPSDQSGAPRHRIPTAATPHTQHSEGTENVSRYLSDASELTTLSTLSAHAGLHAGVHARTDQCVCPDTWGAFSSSNRQTWPILTGNAWFHQCCISPIHSSHSSTP